MALSEFVAKYTAEKMKEADIQKEGNPKSTTYKIPFYTE
jgi:hypothetical protein